MSPTFLVAALVLAHVVVWTIVPTLVHQGLPIDVVEGYSVGRHWMIGDNKHPSLPWWLLDASRIVTGSIGWPAYLLSALCVAATYVCVFAIGRRLFDAERAAVGTLLLSGVLYFSVVTPEFNHNVLQMPMWAGLILALLIARGTGGAAAWIGVGTIAAIGLYAKLSTVILIVTAAMFVVAEPRCRRQLSGFAPWLGVATCALIASPLVFWQLSTHFAAVDYASTRAQVSAGGAGAFLLKQVASSLGLYVLVLAACARHGWTRRLDCPVWTRDGWSPAAIIAFFHTVPLMLAVLVALTSGGGLKGSWGTPMLSLSGLLFVALAPRLVDRDALRRIAAGAAVVTLVVPAIYAAFVIRWDLISQSPPRVAWPQRDIALRLEHLWQQRTGHPLRFVVGDVWHAGMVATQGQAHALPIIDGNLAYAPSVTRADLERDGALIVYGPGPAYPPAHLQWLTAGRIDGQERFLIRAGPREVEGLIWYTIVAPGTVISHTPPLFRLNDRRRVPGRRRGRL